MFSRYLGLLLVLGSSACVVGADSPYGASSGVDAGGGGDLGGAPAEVARGAELYAANCQMCHGGNAVGGAGPGLQGHPGIMAVVRSGSGAMPAFGTGALSDGDVAAIQAWLDWLADGGGAGGSGGSGGGTATGDPYVDNCAGCHGGSGQGTSLAPQIQSPHEGYAAWVVRHGRNTMGFGQAMPAFSETAVSAEELDEIFTFLQSQPMPTDGRGLYLRFCGNCHGPSGGGGVVGESASDDAENAEDFHEVVREGKGDASYGARGDFMPGRGSGELTDAEVEKIRQFLLSSGSGDDDREDDDSADDDSDDDSSDDFGGCTAGGNGVGGLAMGIAGLLLAWGRRRR